MPVPSCPICRRALPVSQADASRRPVSEADASGRPVEPPTPTHPFCSERCKLVDLGNWLDDRYVIAGRDGTAEDVEQLDDEMLAALLREPS